LKALQGFKANGITSVYAISIQNEPQSNNPTYPTALIPVDIEGQIGTALRPLMDKNGFSNISLIGYEHNWDNAAQYPVTLVCSSINKLFGLTHLFSLDAKLQLCV
jgi:O-glycosyl hydrolase